MQMFHGAVRVFHKAAKYLGALPLSLLLLLILALPAAAAGVEDPFKEALKSGQIVIMALVALAVFVGAIVLIAARKFGWALGVVALGIFVAVFVSNPVNVLKSGVNLVCGTFTSLGCNNNWFGQSGLS